PITPTKLHKSHPLQPPSPQPTLFPYTTLFRSPRSGPGGLARRHGPVAESTAFASVGGGVPGDQKSHLPRGDERGKSRHRRQARQDRKSTRLNSSHLVISYAVFCLKKKREHRYH